MSADDKQIRDALRHEREDDRLDDRFYKRARETFETKQPRRFPIWPTVGVAAAAVLAFVLFSPTLVERKDEVLESQAAPPLEQKKERLEVFADDAGVEPEAAAPAPQLRERAMEKRAAKALADPGWRVVEADDGRYLQIDAQLLDGACGPFELFSTETEIVVRRGSGDPRPIPADGCVVPLPDTPLPVRLELDDGR